MVRAVFGRVKPEGEAGPARVTHLDRDAALVAAARHDRTHFDALYRKYLAQVYSYAYYELGDHHEAEDATERTFLAALANLERFEERARPSDGDGASTFRVWLFRIARNVVANERRGRRRHPQAPLDAAALVSDPLDIERGPHFVTTSLLRGARSGACLPIGAARSSSGSSRRCPPPRSQASSAAPKGPFAC